ncbi:MAG: hypothetical protein DWQ21_04460 [Bacteroidetes bacterium]|nr:MAG: hypothetical protein DWQ21_04460 [Bacteroidota bacterium]
MKLTPSESIYLATLLRKDQKKKRKALEKNPQYESFLPSLIKRCDRLVQSLEQQVNQQKEEG